MGSQRAVRFHASILAFLFFTLLPAAPSFAVYTYKLDRAVVNCAGNTYTGSGKMAFDSVGEANVGQSFGHSLSVQAGFFNDYFLPPPTPTITCTPIRSFGGEVINAAFVYAAPNPIRGTTADIYFDLAFPAEVTVKIFTTSNNLVLSKHWDSLSPGTNHWQWNTSGVANGVYLLWIKATGFNGKTTTVIKKLALVK